MKTKALPALQAGLIFLAVGWAYWPALRGDWVWDDLAEVPLNSVLRDPAGVSKIWAAHGSPDYFPLKTTVQWVEWHLWGGHPLGYHLVSVALHFLSALLLWRLLRKLGVGLAWLGGLLFAVHPLAVESVAWISELKNTLSLVWLLLAMICFVDYVAASGVRRSLAKADPLRAGSGGETAPRAGNNALHLYFWSLGLFVAAMLSKSSVVMFPFVLLLYVWWRRGRIAKSDLRDSAPFFAAALALGLVTIWFQETRAAGGVDLALGGPFSRLANAGLAVAFYCWKSVIPLGLMPHYPRWNVTAPSAWPFLSWVALAALLGWLWTKRATWGRPVLFGLGCFLLNLVPVLGFVSMAYLRISRVADHFAYVSLAAAAGLAAAGASALYSRAAAKGAAARGLVGLGLAAMAAALGFATHGYSRIFRNDEAFWAYAVERNPGAWMAQNDLGQALVMHHSDRLPEAIAHYEAALRLKPDYDAAYVNLGNALVQSGRPGEAIGPYEQAVRLKPDSADAQAYLGLALAKAGRLPEAISHYDAALRLNPDLPETENNLGNAWARLGRPAEAGAAYAQALRLRPGFAEAEFNWGNALSDAGQAPEAEAHYEEALRIQPAYPEAHYRWANALANAGRLTEAIGHYEAAVRLRPDFPEAQANLGLAFATADRPQEGIPHLQEAVRLKPDDALAHAYLGFAWGKAGRPAEAIEEYEQALRLKPNDADVEYNLGQALRSAGRGQEAESHFAAAARLGANH